MMHNRKKRELLSSAKTAETSAARLFWGLALLGFASFYREGVEVVLFLQSYRLRLGGATVLQGVLQKRNNRAIASAAALADTCASLK